MNNEAERAHNHYFKDVRKLDFVDVYRVLDMFQVEDPALQHAIKKLLVAGGRGAGKNIGQDVQEAIDSLKRWQEMRREETNDHKVFSKSELDETSKAAFNAGKQKAVDDLTLDDVVAIAHKHGIRVSVAVKSEKKRGRAMSPRVAAELTRRRKAKQR
jgi:hypothetical protein